MKRRLTFTLSFIMALAGAGWSCPISVSAESGSPLGGLGKALGLDDKTINVIEKGAQVAKAMNPIQYEEEAAIGGGVALKVFSRFGGPYPDENLARYVALVGKNVALVSDRPDIPYHFAVLNTEEPNAFAAPGGYIFVTIGLLRKLSSEAELAGILGHEIAHVAKRHSLQTIERGQRLHGISELSLTLMNKDPQLFSDLIDNVSDMLFTKGLDHSLEFEADRFGTAYAARLGYHPWGLHGFLKNLNTHRSQGGASVFFQTHPSPQARISDLEAKVLPQYPNPESFKSAALRFKNHVRD